MIKRICTTNPRNSVYKSNLSPQKSQSFGGRTIFVCNNEKFIEKCQMFYDNLSSSFDNMSRKLLDNTFIMNYPSKYDNVIQEIVKRNIKNSDDIIISHEITKT